MRKGGCSAHCGFLRSSWPCLIGSRVEILDPAGPIWFPILRDWRLVDPRLRCQWGALQRCLRLTVQPFLPHPELPLSPSPSPASWLTLAGVWFFALHPKTLDWYLQENSACFSQAVVLTCFWYFIQDKKCKVFFSLLIKLNKTGEIM